MIGLLLTGVVGGFAYLGGWLTPGKLTAAKFAKAFEAGGAREGFRLNHAKGVCVSGYFQSSGDGAAISKASVFQAGRVAVVGRFSLGGPMAFQADVPGQVRGLGLQLTGADGAVWRTAMINFPVFPFSTPRAFYEMLVASKPDPSTGKPDPAKMQAFAAHNPETVAALKIIKGHAPASGFVDSTFYGLNAFIFTDAQGAVTPVRWVFEPMEPGASTQLAASGDTNFLFDDLIARIARGPVSWHLILVVGEAGDPTNDATIPWPSTRRRIDAGTLTIDRVESDDNSPTALLNFDPLILPDGIGPSDDPLLSARSAVYSASFTRRSGGNKAPSAVTQGDVEKIEKSGRSGE
jgi:catalase